MAATEQKHHAKFLIAGRRAVGCEPFWCVAGCELLGASVRRLLEPQIF